MTGLYERYRDTLRRGHLAALAGRYDDALAAYQEAADLIETRAVPRIGIGRMEAAMGRPAAAVAAFTAALALDPGNAEASQGLDAVRARRVPVAPRGRLRSRGIPDDEPAVGRLASRWEAADRRGDARALLDVAVGLAHADRPTAAATVLRDALSIAPQEPRSFQVSAWLDRRAGRPEAAHETSVRLQRLLTLLDDGDELERRMGEAEDAGDIDGLLDIVERHRRQDRPRAALEAAFAALERAPTDAGVHLAIARCRLDLGLRRRAIVGLDYLARSIELHDDGPGREALAEFVNGELLWPRVGPEAI